MSFLFTSEAVSAGHPDKVCDQISDTLLDLFLTKDPFAHTAIEALATTNKVVLAGETLGNNLPQTEEIEHTVRSLIKQIGYNQSGFSYKNVEITNLLHCQSADIAAGIKDCGAGDQGIMFGYACNETREYMPATLILSHVILKELAVIRREGQVMTYLRPDSKSQVTIEYDEQTNKPLRVHTIVVSTQHDEFILPGNGLTEKEAEAVSYTHLTLPTNSRV